MEQKDKGVQSECLKDAEISGFRDGDLQGLRFLECADHIAQCHACREKLARQGDLDAAQSQFEQDLSPFVDHISDDDIQLYVSGKLMLRRISEIDNHLTRCALCAAEVADLRGFVGSLDRGSRFFLRPVLISAAAVAAAVLIVVLAVSSWHRQTTQIVALNDTSGKLILDADGRVTGGGALDAEQQGLVAHALTQQTLLIPSSLQRIRGTAGTLMGTAEPVLFRLESPVGTVVESSHPTLSWTADSKSAGYKAVVKDESTGETVKSPLLGSTSWTVSPDLERGHTYVWQVVSSHPKGGDAIAPLPSAPPAKFIVLDDSTNAKLQHVSASHLVRAVLYTNAGLLDDASRELTTLEKMNPGSPLLRSFRSQLQQLHTDE